MFSQSIEDHRTPLPIGTKVGPYTIKSVLSKGGSCLTYLAEKDNTATYVIKEGFLPIAGLIRKGMMVSSEDSAYDEKVRCELKRIFDAEIKNANKVRRLKGNNSERVFEHSDITDEVLSNPEFEGTTCRYIAIDTSYGCSLGDISRTTKLSLGAKLIYIREAAISLYELLHKKGYVHADVTPENLYFPGEFDANKSFCILLDFGSSIDTSNVNEQTRISNSGKYSAEEILNKDWKLLGPQSDVYSLAIILIALIAGKEFLNDENNYYRILRRINNNDKSGIEPYLSNEHKYLAERLTLLLQKSVNLDISKRPNTKEFIDELNALIEIVDSKGFHLEVLLQGIIKMYNKDIKPQDDEANPELFAHTTE